MISKMIVLVALILNFINLSTGILTCHGCIASTTSDCIRGEKASYFINECIVAANDNNSLVPSVNGINLKIGPKAEENRAPIITKCVRFAYTDKSHVFVRGCGFIYENVDICKYLEVITNTTGCSWCDTDFCNDKPGWD